MDDLTELHSMLKVETVGPVYMIASGLPTYRPDHCAALVLLALDICDALEDFKDDQGMPLQALMGIHCGPVIGGVRAGTAVAYPSFVDLCVQPRRSA